MKRILTLIFGISLVFTLVGCSRDTAAPSFSNVPDDLVVEYGTNLDLLSLGLTANDNIDGDLTNSIFANYQNTNELGIDEYMIIYSVIDSSGYGSSVRISVQVVDTTKPIITVNRDNLQTIFEIGSEEPYWPDLVMIEDDSFIVLSGIQLSTIDTSLVDMDTVGFFNIYYNYADVYGNEAAEVVITIEIVPVWTDVAYFTYEEINDNTEIRILAYSKDAPKDVIIPEYIDGLPVTEIGNFAFWEINLTSVILPSNLTSIGGNAFVKNALTSVVIPEGVRTIGKSAFYWNEITNVELPSSLTEIGERAFSMNQLTSINIPEGIEVLSVGVFELNYLSNVVIPSGVKIIENSAFYNNNIISVILPEGLRLIEVNAFSSNNITSITIPESVLSIERAAFGHNEITNIRIPASVVLYETGAFYYNPLSAFDVAEDNLYYKDIDGVLFSKDETVLIDYPGEYKDTSYTIPEGVITILMYSFSFSNIEIINIPASVVSQDYQMFEYTKLIEINVSEDNLFLQDIDGVLFNKEGTVLIAYPKGNLRQSYTIPDGVVIITDNAFRETILRNVIIPNSVTIIGAYSFFLSELKSITIPDSVTTIGISCFWGNPLTSISILGDGTRFNDEWSYIGFNDLLKPIE